MTQLDHVRLLTPGGSSRHWVSRVATVVALTLASAAGTWTTSGVSLSLTDLTGTLSASSDEASWALTVYMSAFAVSIALSHRLSVRLGTAASITDRALAGAVRRQSSVLSYADVFYAMTVVAVVTLFFVPLLPTLSTAAPPEKRPEEPAANPAPSYPLGVTK